MALSGEYSAVKNNIITNTGFVFPEAKILYQGLQLSVGAVLK